MEADLLEALLMRTDAALPAPAGRGRLSHGAIMRAARRMQVRAAAAVLLAIAITTAVLHSLSAERPRMPGEWSVVDVGRCRGEIAALEAEAMQHEQIAGRLAIAERQSEALRQARVQAALSADPLAGLEAAREQAARVLVIDAERHLADGVRPEQAIEDYRRVVDLFPETTAAHEAAERIKLSGV